MYVHIYSSSSWTLEWQQKHQQPHICRWYHSNGRKWRGTKECLNESEGREWKSQLKIKYLKKKKKKKAKFTASGPITSRQTEGENVEAVTDFLFLGSKITVHGDCNHEIRRWLHLGRKAMTNLDRVLKSRDVTLLIKVSIVKPMVFPMVTYGCKSWTVKKAECQKIDAFRLWCCWRLLRAPWTARRLN